MSGRALSTTCARKIGEPYYEPTLGRARGPHLTHILDACTPATHSGHVLRPLIPATHSGHALRALTRGAHAARAFGAHARGAHSGHMVFGTPSFVQRAHRGRRARDRGGCDMHVCPQVRQVGTIL